MTDMDARRFNKRIEAVASVNFNLGAALAGAAGVRLYANLTVDWTLAIWSFGAVTLIWIGWMLFGLLEAED